MDMQQETTDLQSQVEPEAKRLRTMLQTHLEMGHIAATAAQPAETSMPTSAPDQVLERSMREEGSTLPEVQKFIDVNLQQRPVQVSAGQLVQSPGDVPWPLGDLSCPTKVFVRNQYPQLLSQLRYSATKSHAVLILGSQGVGKTTLMNLLLQQLIAAQRSVFVQQCVKDRPTRFWWWDRRAPYVGTCETASDAAKHIVSGMVVISDGDSPSEWVVDAVVRKKTSLIISSSPKTGQPLIKKLKSVKLRMAIVSPWDLDEALTFIRCQPASPNSLFGVNQDADAEEVERRFGLCGGVARSLFDADFSCEDFEAEHNSAIRDLSAGIMHNLQHAVTQGHWPALGERLILLDVLPAAAVSSNVGAPCSVLAFKFRAVAAECLQVRFCSRIAMTKFVTALNVAERQRLLLFIAAARNWSRLGVVCGHVWEDVVLGSLIAGFQGPVRKLKAHARAPAEPATAYQHPPSTPSVFTSLSVLGSQLCRAGEKQPTEEGLQQGQQQPQEQPLEEEQGQQQLQEQQPWQSPFKDTVYIPSYTNLGAADALKLEPVSDGQPAHTLITYQATVADKHDVNIRELEALLAVIPDSANITVIKHHFVVPNAQFLTGYKVQQVCKGGNPPCSVRGRLVQLEQYAVELKPE